MSQPASPLSNTRALDDQGIWRVMNDDGQRGRLLGSQLLVHSVYQTGSLAHQSGHWGRGGDV